MVVVVVVMVVVVDRLSWYSLFPLPFPFFLPGMRVQFLEYSNHFEAMRIKAPCQRRKQEVRRSLDLSYYPWIAIPASDCRCPKILEIEKN